MKRISIICLVASLCLPWCPSRSLAQMEPAQDPSIIRDVSIGIKGLYKLGAWAPVRVTLSAGDRSLDGSLRIIVPDGDGQMSAYESNDVAIAAGQEQTAWTYVKVGRTDFALTVEFVESNGETHRKTVPARDVPTPRLSSEQVVISVGEDPDVDAALKLRIRPSREQQFHESVRETESLPDHMLGYSGVDVIILVASDAQLFDAAK